MSNVYETAEQAFIDGVRLLLIAGQRETVRGMETRELLHHSFKISNPLQRVMLVPGRNANVFAQVAETLWMLSGRNDLLFLSRYIPSASKFSDDGGNTWRGAYGPRLRAWVFKDTENYNVVDQMVEVAQKLRADPQTRQAVITLWNPGEDWVRGSKDYPCNNWIHFMIRDNKLHLSVAVRSNDAWRGFSHADFFGWSVLQQMMAYWTGTQVGQITWFASSWHIYAEHFDKAAAIGKPYYLELPVPAFSTRLENFDLLMTYVWHYENVSRSATLTINGQLLLQLSINIQDDFLRNCTLLMMTHNRLQHYLTVKPVDGMSDTELYMLQYSYMGDMEILLNAMDACDLRLAALDYIKRKTSFSSFGFLLAPWEVEYLALTHNRVS